MTLRLITFIAAGLCLALNAIAEPALPLRTGTADGRTAVLDAHGQRVHLKGINWFGAESETFMVGGLDRQSLTKIIGLIKTGGFNIVRLPWSNEMAERNPVVADEDVLANPQFKGKRALDVYDAVVKALSDAEIMVIIDNHRSRGDWCCDKVHGDGLWYTQDYSEDDWLSDWRMMAARYKHNPYVVAVELRNEIREDYSMGLNPQWGNGDPKTDWRLAALKGAETVLSINPKLLVIVGTPNFQGTLAPVRNHPMTLSVPNRLIYAPHDYAWDHTDEELADPALFAESVHDRWEFVREPGHPYSAPVLITEWGGCVQSHDPSAKCARFVRAITDYQKKAQIDWVWWPLNGTQLQGYNRTRGDVETYGLLTPDWSGWAAPDVVRDLIN